MRKEKILILISFLAFISLGLPDGLLGVAWPFISDRLQVPLDRLGILLISFVAGYLSSSLSNSKIMEKVSLGLLLTMSCFLTGTSLFAFVLIEEWFLLIIAAYFLGTGGGAIDTSINVFASAKFSASVVNWLHAFYGIGATSGPLILTAFIIQGHTWKAGYWSVGSIQILLGILFFATSKLWEQQDKEDNTSSHTSYIKILSQPKVWVSIMLFFLYTGTEIGIGQWLYSILIKSRNVSEASGGFWVSAYWGSLTLGRIVFGFVLKKVATPKVIFLAASGLILGTLVLFLNINMQLSFMAVVLVGLSCAPIFPSMISSVNNWFGTHQAGTIIGFQVSAAMMGGALLPAFSGFLSRQYGLEIITLVFFIQAILLLIGYIMLKVKVV
ncbi:MFS transporter [Cecembia sp.]|uniref:MFS transporter n=1 Tax=Cecembia sp. TaxID=1898110 RepID=UPI0025C0FED0|nr:MFS transporter [Cecembia sp.]